MSCRESQRLSLVVPKRSESGTIVRQHKVHNGILALLLLRPNLTVQGLLCKIERSPHWQLQRWRLE